MRSPVNFITVEEYLELELTARVRHEYVAGQIYAMVGASEAHNIIVTNLIAILRPYLRGSSCKAFVSDMKVKVKTQQADIFYYPDLLVTCDPGDNEKYFKTKPSLIIEILSKSTEVTDRREKRCDPADVSSAKERASRKRLNYQAIDSLQEYILISQYEMKVEIYFKDGNNNWMFATLGEDDDLVLDSVGLKLTMSDIYEDVFY